MHLEFFLPLAHLLLESLKARGYDTQTDINFRDTAARAAKGFCQMAETGSFERFSQEDAMQAILHHMMQSGLPVIQPDCVSHYKHTRKFFDAWAVGGPGLAMFPLRKEREHARGIGVDLGEDNPAFRLFLETYAADVFSRYASKTAIVNYTKDMLQGGERKEWPGDYEDVIFQGPVWALGLCPHHLLPVRYECYLAVIPGESSQLLGLSKYARLAQTVLQRAELQEQSTGDLARLLCSLDHGISQKDEDAELELEEDTEESEVSRGWPKNSRSWFTDVPRLETRGAAVYVKGLHMCMSARGVEAPCSRTTTVAKLGAFFTHTHASNEFLGLIADARACQSHSRR